MIKIFFRNKYKKEFVNRFLSDYEERYYFIDKISDFEKRRQFLLDNIEKKGKSLSELITRWIRENYFDDQYSRCLKLPSEEKNLFESRILYKNILYIKMKNISLYNAECCKKALLPKRDYLVLDLRSNCGGSVEAAQKIINYFVENKNHFQIQGRKTSKIYGSYENKLLSNYKYIFILVNRFTMSSAEIIMMSLYMHLNNVIIIGEKTYKKQYGQITLSDSRCGLMVSYTGFEWNVDNCNIIQFWEKADTLDRIYILDLISDDEYMKKVYSLVT